MVREILHSQLTPKTSSLSRRRLSHNNCLCQYDANVTINIQMLSKRALTQSTDIAAVTLNYCCFCYGLINRGIKSPPWDKLVERHYTASCFIKINPQRYPHWLWFDNRRWQIHQSGSKFNLVQISVCQSRVQSDRDIRLSDVSRPQTD